MQLMVQYGWSPCSTLGKQAMHFSETRVAALYITFLKGQARTHSRYPRQRSWSTRTMPSSGRL